MTILDTLVTNRAPGASYSFQDMNRVGEAMEYISARLRECGFRIPWQAKTDFTRTDFPTPAVFGQYLGQLQALHDAVALFVTTPPVPVVGEAKDYMTVEEANDIERILLDIQKMLGNMACTYRHCGVPVCGLEDLRR
nr:hypothetical protein [uncultured Oscillibacter sp.]